MCIIALGSKPKGPIIGIWGDGVFAWSGRDISSPTQQRRNETGRVKVGTERMVSDIARDPGGWVSLAGWRWSSICKGLKVVVKKHNFKVCAGGISVYLTQESSGAVNVP